MKTVRFFLMASLLCGGTLLQGCDKDATESVTSTEDGSWQASFRVSSGELTESQLSKAAWVRVEAWRSGSLLTYGEVVFSDRKLTLMIPTAGDVTIKLTGYNSSKDTVMWTGSGTVSSGVAKPGTGMVTLAAGPGLAVAKRTYALTTSATNGTITLTPSGGTYDSGTSVMVTATPNNGYRFNGWSDECLDTSKPCTIVMTGNKSLTANFTMMSGISTAVSGMKLIPAGSFMMGSLDSEMGRFSDETQHNVTLSAFYMDSTNVTQGQYFAVMGVNPSSFAACGTACPVEQVSWFDAVLYCNARSKLAGLDTVYSYTGLKGVYGNGTTALIGIAADLSKYGYRLPTEAQWEYAARGGTVTAYYWGNDTTIATVSKYAWFAGNNSSSTHPVATKLPNAYGLYDMAGNVWQWTGDWYGVYSTTAQSDPSGVSDSGRVFRVGVSIDSGRVSRGGSWGYPVASLRSSYRHYFNPVVSNSLIGFRVVLPAQ